MFVHFVIVRYFLTQLISNVCCGLAELTKSVRNSYILLGG